MMADQFDPFPHKDPPLFDATAASIIDEARALIEATTAICDDLVARIGPDDADFDNTIRPLAENDNLRSGTENHLRFHASTSPFPELRDASNAAASMLDHADTDFFSRRSLFVLVDAVFQTSQKESPPPPPPLDDQSIYYLSKLHQRFVSNGCGIADDALRATFVAQKKRLSEVAREIRRNMVDDATGLWLTRAELAGVPDSLMRRLALGADAHADHYWLPTKVPFTTPVLKSATREATRKRVQYAVANRLPANVPLFREMTLLRDATARLLGWPHHFAFRAAQKMVRSPAPVKRLMAEVRAGLAPFAERQAHELREAKRRESAARDASADDVQLFSWDMLYFQRRVNETARLSDARVSEYFELHTTLRKLLDIYEHLFGVRLVPVDTAARARAGEKLVWHPDVRMFAAWDVDGPTPEFLAYAYFDLYPREGKYTHHAAHYTLQRRYQKPDGSWFDPSSCLVTNFIKPTDDQPSLLSLDNVRSLFHEMGHMYHCMLSRARYARLHSVDSDFVEVPSMMLEHFLWDPHILRDVSHHYSHISPTMRQAWLSTREGNPETTNTTPEIPLQLSLDEATSLAESHTVDNIRSALSTLSFATYDMRIHSPASHDELEQTSLAALFNQTRADIFRIPGGEALGEGWDYSQGQSVFRAIQGKYDAGYYAYILGRLFALDIFQRGFAAAPMDPRSARRYRDMVLCPGGRQPEMKTLTDYLGRAPSARPYLDWLGVTPGAEGPGVGPPLEAEFP